MILSCIAAMTTERVIGRNGGLPWRLPADLKHFKRVTMGHPVIMGRKTWEEIGKPLPGRLSIVLSRQKDLDLPAGVLLRGTLAEALEPLAEQEEVFVIGGAEIFAAALPASDRIYLTEIHADIEGDTFFPDVPREEWQLVSESRREADERNPHDMTFRLYERK
ncbi:MAG: dihydrofolate reductase [Gemmatimonadetes bacterium]|nr:dihydrofolate reductase [Gemmatimonadota bacterium]